MSHQFQDFKRTVCLVGLVTRNKDDVKEKKHSFTVAGMGWEHFIGCSPGQVPEVGSVVELECEWSEFDGKVKPGKLIHIERFDGQQSAAVSGAGDAGRSSMFGAGKKAA